MKNKENEEKLKTKDNFGIAFEILNEKQRKMKKINKYEENLKEKKANIRFKWWFCQLPFETTVGLPTY
jgi:hypothetical protein